MSKLIYKLKRTLRRLPSRTPLNESRYDEIPNLLSELESGSIESTTRPIECTESNTTEGDIADRNSTESNITNTPEMEVVCEVGRRLEMNDLKLKQIPRTIQIGVMTISPDLIQVKASIRFTSSTTSFVLQPNVPWRLRRARSIVERPYNAKVYIDGGIFSSSGSLKVLVCEEFQLTHNKEFNWKLADGYFRSKTGSVFVTIRIFETPIEHEYDIIDQSEVDENQTPDEDYAYNTSALAPVLTSITQPCSGVKTPERVADPVVPTFAYKTPEVEAPWCGVEAPEVEGLWCGVEAPEVEAPRCGVEAPEELGAQPNTANDYFPITLPDYFPITLPELPRVPPLVSGALLSSSLPKLLPEVQSTQTEEVAKLNIPRSQSFPVIIDHTNSKREEQVTTIASSMSEEETADLLMLQQEEEKEEVVIERVEPAISSPEAICLPDHFTVISTLTCTSDGLRFKDKDNDFIMEIPEGAIPHSESLIIDVGVALFGPFQFPEGLRPVSPVFWVCVRHQPDFIFSKPVSLTIPHFLHLENEEDIQSLGLTFFKAGHHLISDEVQGFHQFEGRSDFSSSNTFGTVECSHFCSLCITAINTSRCLENTKFCITSVIPRYTVPVGKIVNAYFFVTFFNLKTCLKKVGEIIEKKNLKENCKIKKVPFRFGTETAVEMTIHQPENQTLVGCRGQRKISRHEVDFFVEEQLSKEELEDLQDEDFYPPRFEVFFAPPHHNPTLRGCKISFLDEIDFDIFLEGAESLLTNGADDVSQAKLDTDVLTAKEYLKDLNAQELRDLFQELGLYHYTVHNHTGSTQHIAAELIRLWMLKEDNVMKIDAYTGATWADLKNALKKLNHHGLASKISF